MAKKKDSASSGSLNPAKLSCADFARVLSQAGGEPVSETDVRDTIRDGAPKNKDGTIHLVHYTAWLVAGMK